MPDLLSYPTSMVLIAENNIRDALQTPLVHLMLDEREI
jgi:hypothetical protein